MTHYLIRAAALLCCALSLAGCATLGALNAASTPGDAYELRPPPNAPRAASTQNVQLVIDVPTASGAIDTDRILVRPNASQVQYLPGAQWTQAAPVMVQSVLVETFLRTGGFRFVGQRPIGPVGDILLVTHLSDFGVDIDPASGQGTVVLSLTANLVREEDAAILSSRRFSREARIEETAAPAIIAGFETVSNAVFSELAGWV
ncbi:MAG: ABC-type transport auxiliary lipoprotein family protein, partial [Pseudomonadota bacterium]